MGSENDAIIEEAVEALRLRLIEPTLHDTDLQAAIPRRDDDWMAPGVRLIFPKPFHELVVRPVGEDGAEVEVIEDDVILTCETERGYTSADDLSERIERVYAATRRPPS